MTKPPTTSTLLVDDERVRVTRFDFDPRGSTGWHTHEHDYVIVTLTDCPMRIEEPGDAVREVDVPAGTAYRRHRGVEHDVMNRSDAPMSFIEIELE